MNLSLIYGTVIGILLGLAYCYWNQLQTAYQNRGLIGAAGNVSDDLSNLYNEVRAKF